MEGRKVTGWAARDSSAILSPYSFHLRYLTVNPTQNLINNCSNNVSNICISSSPCSGCSNTMWVQNVQKNRSRRCIIQGLVLWSRPHRPSSNEERGSLHYLPVSSRVGYFIFTTCFAFCSPCINSTIRVFSQARSGGKNCRGGIRGEKVWCR